MTASTSILVNPIRSITMSSIITVISSPVTICIVPIFPSRIWRRYRISDVLIVISFPWCHSDNLPQNFNLKKIRNNFTLQQIEQTLLAKISNFSKCSRSRLRTSPSNLQVTLVKFKLHKFFANSKLLQANSGKSGNFSKQFPSSSAKINFLKSRSDSKFFPSNLGKTPKCLQVTSARNQTSPKWCQMMMQSLDLQNPILRMLHSSQFFNQ